MELFLVPVAHVSKRSVEQVRRAIEKYRPEVVAIELDPQRLVAMTKKKEPRALEFLAKPFFGLLYLFQKFMGKQLKVTPGNEMLEAVKAAQEAGIPIALVDRPIGQTMQRMSLIPLREKLSLVAQVVLAPLMFVPSPFARKKVSIEEMAGDRELVEGILMQFKKKLPVMYKVLVDERDEYMFRRVASLKAERVVLVVGAGHLKGITRRLDKMNEEILANKKAREMAGETGGAAS